MTSFDPNSGYYGNEIIVADLRVPVAAPVLTMEDHGLEFRAGKGARRRFPKQLIDLIVVHWTGGERGARQVFRTLTSRALGVEFVVDPWGIIWQFADPARVDTFDAKGVNPRSIGIEMTNFAFRRPGKPIPRPGRDRPRYRTQLNGRAREFASFTPWQMKACVALCDALTATVRTIPRTIPRNGNNNLIRRKLKKAELDAYAGVLGHFHVSGSKLDPGTDIFEMFDAAGYE